MSDSQDKHADPRSRSQKGTLITLLAATVVAAGGLFGWQAMAQTDTYRHLSVAAADGGWHHGWRRGHHGRFANLSDAEIVDRVERMVKHVSIEIDATEEQESRLIELATGAARALLPMRGEMRQTREAMHELLKAETIDREALDRLRTQRLADLDRASKTMIDTLADAAEVLTPQQRELLEERIEEFRSHRRRDRRG